ncbi:MAG: hypothetical protein GXO26_01680, partial [Crenarchaeota archaeon]|nr:hypothetical protein [Thermoproteota archaeon]
MNELLKQYIVLKMIAVEWSYGKLTKESKEILRKLRISSLLELDKLVHILHKKITRSVSIENFSVSGDGLVLMGILKVLGKNILDATGDGVRKPLYLMLDNVSVSIALHGDSAEILYETDSPLDEIEYGLRYIYDIEETISFIRKNKMQIKDGKIIVKALNPYAVDLTAEKVCGVAELVDVIEKDEYWEYVFKPTGEEDIETTADIVAEVLAVYTTYDADEDVIFPEYTRSERVLSYILQKLSSMLPCKLSYTRPEFSEIHIHGEESRIHVHVKGEVLLRGEPDILLKVIPVVVSALDNDFEKDKPECI